MGNETTGFILENPEHLGLQMSQLGRKNFLFSSCGFSLLFPVSHRKFLFPGHMRARIIARAGTFPRPGRVVAGAQVRVEGGGLERKIRSRTHA